MSRKARPSGVSIVEFEVSRAQFVKGELSSCLSLLILHASASACRAPEHGAEAMGVREEMKSE